MAGRKEVLGIRRDATLLPGKWNKPAMQMGVLPVHAQSSVCNAEIEYVSEGYCEDFPELACGEFNYYGRFSYTPTDLTPSRVSTVVCGENVSSGVIAGTPGILYVVLDIEDLQCEGTRQITVTFVGGCVGVWESSLNETRQPGSLFR